MTSAPRPQKPMPELTKKQIGALRELADADGPRPGATLECFPLCYKRLAASEDSSGFPRYTITDRGRRWLVQYDAYIAARPTRTRKATS